VNESNCVLAQYKRASETIVAAHHADDAGSYTYTVLITGGRHHGVEFHCRTEQSALKVFDRIVALHKAEAGESDDSAEQ
jgi:hypothetical protein